MLVTAAKKKMIEDIKDGKNPGTTPRAGENDETPSFI